MAEAVNKQLDTRRFLTSEAAVRDLERRQNEVALIAEMYHTASLYHDDVLDKAQWIIMPFSRSLHSGLFWLNIAAFTGPKPTVHYKGNFSLKFSLFCLKFDHFGLKLD